MSEQHIFIIGAKSIGQYGGFETFVQKLIEYNQNEDIKFHIACKANGEGCMDESKLEGIKVVKTKDDAITEFMYKNAHAYKIQVPNIGPAVAIYYDIKALKYAIKYCIEHKIPNPYFYILACRIGPCIAPLKKKIKKIGGTLCINPDGHEWMRRKWSAPVRKYWKYSEKMMVKYADLIICDSKNIEKYIQTEYSKYNPKTTFIPYGAEIVSETINQTDFENWAKENDVKEHQYYLSVGRFVKENNYDIIIREFLKSNSNKKMILITNKNDKLLSELDNKMHFKNNKRIIFAKAVYNQDLLKAIRINAYGYIHGHEVGGTNPSLLESLGSTNMNLLLNVPFNKEVGEESCLYWEKDNASLSNIINTADNMNKEEYEEYGKKAKERISSFYNWTNVAKMYANIFCGE